MGNLLISTVSYIGAGMAAILFILLGVVIGFVCMEDKDPNKQDRCG